MLVTELGIEIFFILENIVNAEFFIVLTLIPSFTVSAYSLFGMLSVLYIISDQSEIPDSFVYVTNVFTLFSIYYLISDVGYPNRVSCPIINSLFNNHIYIRKKPPDTAHRSLAYVSGA